MRIRGLVLGGIIASACAGGCTKQGSPIGANYVNDNLNVLYIDTVTLQTSTVLLDSVATSGTNVIAAGSYTDPYLGKVSASSYMEMGIPSFNVVLSNAVYDSCAFILLPNGFFYGDTTRPQQFSVHALSTLLYAHTTTGLSYNVDTVPVDPSPLGQGSFLPSPGVPRYISIRLNDQFGDTLLHLMASKDLRGSVQSNFRNFFHGVALVPGPANTGVMGFRIGKDSATVIRIYYHYPGLTPTVQTLDFPVTNNIAQFNHFTSDRTGTPLAGLDSKNLLGIPAARTGNQTFVESGVGLATRIQLPTLPKIGQLAQYGAVIQARLVVQPQPFTYRGNLYLPQDLMLLVESNANTVIDTVTSPGGRLNGSLVIDYVNNLNTAYEYDVTSYVSALINNPGKGIGNLLLVTPSFFNATGVTRTILSTQHLATNTPAMKLEIYFIVYKQVP